MGEGLYSTLGKIKWINTIQTDSAGREAEAESFFSVVDGQDLDERGGLFVASAGSIGGVMVNATI